MSAIHRQRGWWYDTEFISCTRCGGTGENVECYDDLCHAKGRCMHGDNTCALCSGVGRISVDLGAIWESRDAFEAVTAPDSDLWVQGKLHGVARRRHFGGEADA